MVNRSIESEPNSSIQSLTVISINKLLERPEVLAYINFLVKQARSNCIDPISPLITESDVFFHSFFEYDLNDTYFRIARSIFFLFAVIKQIIRYKKYFKNLYFPFSSFLHLKKYIGLEPIQFFEFFVLLRKSIVLKLIFLNLYIHLYMATLRKKF